MSAGAGEHERSRAAHERVRRRRLRRRPSMRARLSLLLGDRRGPVVALGVSSVLSGFAEAGDARADRADRRRDRQRGAGTCTRTSALLHLHATVGDADRWSRSRSRCSPAAAVAALDPAGADRRRRAGAAAHAAVPRLHPRLLGVQSRDREGQLQETMTSQVMQATGGALQATTLITSLAHVRRPADHRRSRSTRSPPRSCSSWRSRMFAAAAAAERARRRAARARSPRRRCSTRAAIAEANRLAEETQVFGVAAAQRERIDGCVETARELFFRTQC